MDDGAQCMGTSFVDWQDLTQAYLAAIEALRRGEPGATEALRRLAIELERCELAVAQYLVRSGNFSERVALGSQRSF